MKIYPFQAYSMLLAKTGTPRGNASHAIMLSTNLQKKLKEVVGQQAPDMQGAKVETGMNNPKVKFLIDSFKNGMKLSSAEMAYIRSHAPEMYDYVSSIMRQRQLFEQSMRMAPSKLDVQMAFAIAGKRLEKNSLPEERETLAKHILNAKSEYEKTDEYKEKPKSSLDKKERQKRVIPRKIPQDRTQYVIQAYANVKLPERAKTPESVKLPVKES